MTRQKTEYAVVLEKQKAHFSSSHSPYILVHDSLHSDHSQLKLKQNSVNCVINCYYLHRTILTYKGDGMKTLTVQKN
jgi:hypothetical protein